MMNAFDFVRARDGAARPAPMLGLVAGEHAARIAQVWPAPHIGFLTLPAPRRHLAAIALGRTEHDAWPNLAARIERAPLRDGLALAVRPIPRGLARALTVMGEALWAGRSYDTLVDLLREPNANLVLRHADALDEPFAAKLALLPAALRATRILANLPTPAAAAALAEAFAAARWINAHRPERDLVLAWARANGPDALMRAAIDALKPDRFGGLGPAPDPGPPYRRLMGRAAVENAALRFRNCIADYLWEVGAEELALYIKEGDAPAVVALKRDVGGWRFAEALGAGNAALDDATLEAIAADMARAGARIGLPIRALEDRLECITEALGAPGAPTPTLASRLGLGQLWR